MAGGACIGAGVGPNRIHEVIGVVKAYTSRVGDGPFPTGAVDETGKWIRETGHEYGVTTGRPRRIGWLDLVMLNYASVLNGFTGFALTRLDVLSGLDKVKVAYAYKRDGQVVSNFPASFRELAKCEPVYEEFPGWPEINPKAKSLDDLHPAARRFIEFITEKTGVEFPWFLWEEGEKTLLRLESVPLGGPEDLRGAAVLHDISQVAQGIYCLTRPLEGYGMNVSSTLIAAAGQAVIIDTFASPRHLQPFC